MKRTIFLRVLSFILPVVVSLGISSCAAANGETVNIGTDRTEGVVTFSADDDAVSAATSHYILIAGKREIQIFNESGKRVYYKQTRLNEPQVLSDGSYFLVYDKNGSSCFLFKNEKCMAELQSEYAVYAACLDSGGTFALVTRTYTSASAVLLYNASGSLKHVIQRSDYTVDCQLSSTGRLVLLTLDADDGEWITSVTAYKLRASDIKIVYEKTFKNIYPYQCSLNGSRVAVACSDGVHVFDRKGKNHLVETDSAVGCNAVLQSNGLTVLLYNDTIVFYDVKGKKKKYESPLTTIESSAFYGDYLFLSQGRTIVRINVKNGDIKTGTAPIDFNKIVLKEASNQIYLSAMASFVLYNAE